MKQGKCILLLKSLSKKELRGFSEFIKGLHQDDKDIFLLFTYLVSLHPKFGRAKSYDKQVIHSNIYPDKDFNYGKISDDLSELSRYIEDYLLLQEFRKKTFDREFHLAKIFQKKRLNGLFYQQLNKAEKITKKIHKRELWTYLQTLQIHHYRYFASDTDKVSIGEIEIIKARKSLDLFYFAVNLRYECELKSRSTILSQDMEGSIGEESVIHHFRKKTTEVLHEIYLDLLDLIEKKDPDRYYKFKEKLPTYQEVLSKRELFVILSYLLNFVAAKLRVGKSKSLEEAFFLYDYGLQNKILLVDNYFQKTQFINIVYIACRLKLFDWLAEFMRKNKTFIQPNDRNATVSLSKAVIAFEKGNYLDAIALTNSVKYVDPFFKLRSRFLLLRSYVELDYERKIILDLCRAIKASLSRDKRLGDETISAALNTVKFLSNLYGTKKIKKNLLATQVEQVKLIFFRPWLLDKIHQIGIRSRP